MIDIETLISAWKGHRQFAHKAMQIVRPNITVDLGVDRGFSLFSFAECDIGKVYGIDSFEGDIHAGYHADAFQTVVNVILENQYKNIEIIKGYFDDVVKDWDKPIDILHIDGLHTYEAVKNDFDKWSPFLTEDGLLLMHDTTAFPTVAQLYNEIPWHKFSFSHSAGLGVLSKNRALIDKLLQS